MPTKKLSQMTVEDICLLIRNISDLSVNQRGQKRTDRGLTKSKSTRESSKPGGLISSDESDSPINDPVPPAPINERRKLANTSNPYEDRIKQLNVTGTVLSICPLSDLQKELNMSFGDWQLFSSVVNYLKNKELGQLTPKSAGPSHTCGSRQSDQFRRSDPRLSRGASEQSGKWPHESHLISTVSDTSLALTVKSVPLTQPGRSPPQLRSISGVKNTKSMSALPSVSRTGTGLTYGQTTQRQQSALCPQHSRMAQNMAASNPTALLCPRHKEQVKSFLSGSQRELENAIDLTKRSQSDLRSRDSWDALVTQGQPKRQMYGAQTKPSASGYPVGLQRSPPTGASLTPRQQLKQAQFLDERSSTLPNSFRENLPPASANFVHAQYCAMHQKGKSPNWPLSSQPTWTTPGNPRDNAVASNHTTAESSIPLHRTSGESIPSNREANRLHTHRSLKLHSASAAKEHQVFDFSTPAREHLSHLDQMPSSSGQVARAEFCLPKDSESTSIAGELVEEVAEFSPALLEQDSSVSHDHVGRGEEKVESSDHQSSHSCDCNYWYSLEAAAAAAAVGVTAGATGSMKRLRDSRLTPSGIGYPGLDPDPDQSISDSLSTTRSQLDVSSGTSSDRSSTDASSNDEPDKLG
ncbi:unnamed protein product [Echinostoma caproni]|uniref:Protein kinase domain-containing protein n=1 Tax=Echinostoma caproni TaxID=27848 RepID=A0A183B187_9TREM|nr:unnamed protein product [Echinostoma caproni]